MRSSMKKGFTLIELLIVVVIIGILAAVAIPKFTATKQRASRSAGIADMRNLATAQEGFFADSNRFALIADTGSAPGRMNFTPSVGNTNLTLVGNTTGWSGTVNIPGGQVCGIFNGTAARPTGMPAATPSGVPVCWP
jgi:type IV pilus assembly protein PilA